MGVTQRSRAWRGRLVFAAVAAFLSLLASAQLAAQQPSTYGPVSATETLWSVANKVRVGRAGTTAQMAWALFKANPQAFDGSPSKIRPNSTLQIPDSSVVLSVPAAQAYELITGKAPAPAVAARPAPAPATALTAAETGPAPVITRIALEPRAKGEPHQWLFVGGSGFEPGATLELRQMVRGAKPVVRKPQAVRADRIDYAARFPQKAGPWQVVVRNPNGARSVPVEFEGGANVTVAWHAPIAAPPVVAVPTLPAPVAPAPEPVVASTVFAGSADEATAKQMAQKGESPEALYRFLAPLEGQYAGDVDYDYLLGTTAFDSGRFAPAIFVLQRAVVTRPGFAGARMELARAYYAQGDNEAARREFAILEKDNPPPEALRAIAEYKVAMDRRAAAYEPRLGAFGELAAGFDSNANGSPDTQTFLGFNLDERNQATSSGYYGGVVGGLVSHPMSPTWRLLGNGALSMRSNPDTTFVDSQAVRLAGGAEWRPNEFELGFVPSYTYSMLDGEENNTVLALDVAGTWHIEDWQMSANVRSGQTRFADALSVQDIDTLAYGIASQIVLPGRRRMMLMSALTLGSDDAVESYSPFGRDFRGARVATFLELGGPHALMIASSTLSADYDGIFFGRKREDRQSAATLAYEWGGLRVRGISVRAQINFISNASSVALYDYNRIDAGVSLHKEFK